MLVSITFDDGNEYQYNGFFPILEKYDLKGTFYIVTSWIGQQGILNWDQLAELHSGGNEIGSHTHTHRNLTNLSKEALDFELHTSFTFLNRFDCKTLAYPNGGYNSLVIGYAKKYYIGARAYFMDKAHFHVSKMNESYSLIGLATEESSTSGTIPLLNLPFDKFEKEIIKLTKGGSDNWTILVFHGQQITAKVFLGSVKTFVENGRALNVSLIKNSLRSSIAYGNTLKKFQWLCKYLARNDNLETVTVSDGIKKLYGG